MRTTLRTLVLLPLTALVAAGCSALGGEDKDGAITLSFANSYSTEHAHSRCGITAVADKINKQDLGLTIETFPNSQLGGDSARFTSVMSGDVHMDVQGSSALAATFKPVGVLDMAYAVDGPDHLFSFFDSSVADKMKQDFLAATGARVLDVWFFGMRHFTANKPIRTPADLEGLRMRYPDSPTYLENAKAVGAKATAVAFEEVYLGLQQGIIDGQENPIPTIAAQSFDEVQSHVSLSGHQTGSQLIVINEDQWQRMSGDQQRALQAAVHETRAENRGCIEKDEAAIVDEWKKAGKPTVVEDVARAAFSERASQHFTGTLTGAQLELYKTIRASAGS